MGRAVPRRPDPRSALFDGYLGPDTPPAGAYDEMFAADGTVRAPYRALHDAIVPAAADPAALDLARAAADDASARSERPVPLDVVPRVISAGEWGRLEKGIVQRVRALEAFLADVHGAAEIVRHGILPRRLITSCERFHRAAVGIVAPNGVRIHVAGIDLGRDGDGTVRVLADHLRHPAGVARVLENRRVTARVFPDLVGHQRVRGIDDHPAQLLRALRAAAPGNPADPMVVVLTPGTVDPAHVEHAQLARRMGVRLVEGRDLVCRDNRVHLRTTGDEQRVDVIYRRVDDELLDPLQFDPTSVLGVAGLLNAARAGHVVIANAVGNGVADDALVHTHVPRMIGYYLGEEPLLPQVDTFRCWLDDERAHVLAHLDELVLRPVGAPGGRGVLVGPDASARRLAAARADIRGDPRGWIARPVVQLSTVPTKVGGRLVPRPVDLRVFAVNDGESIFVLPGGLTRPAGGPGNPGKDTWVLAPSSRGAK